MAANILKPLKAFRVGEPIPVPTTEIECGPMRLEKIPDKVMRQFLEEVGEIPPYSPPETRIPKGPYPTFGELYGAEMKIEKLLKPVRLPKPAKPRRFVSHVYRHTHDHTTRTTTLRMETYQGGLLSTYLPVPGILTLRQVKEVHGI